MNADGLDDIVCIDSKGNADLAINQGNGDRSAKKPPTFKNLGRIKDNEGKGRSNVVMADIDGDGRGDYGVMDSKGTISFWRNGWVEDKPKYWQALGVRWTDQYTREIKGVRFEDINGDVSTKTSEATCGTLTQNRAGMTGCGWTKLVPRLHLPTLAPAKREKRATVSMLPGVKASTAVKEPVLHIKVSRAT